MIDKLNKLADNSPNEFVAVVASGLFVVGYFVGRRAANKRTTVNVYVPSSKFEDRA
jgi:hypothetical protein